ncbi:unnamed protein product [Cladocopium goreaui]|uniref:ATP-dependent RNA helicase TDRD9 (Tudo r domain-containing protein 9) n=1 Tax=Cladocopium goreaui TaxID=2562237 RepID=A0A9P1BT15_9DINO|nr:unnamed protein product [Cladocopium goreaui]
MPMVFLEDPKSKIAGAVTQPRRIAAISLAQRVASQLNESVGQTVGYRVAMDGQVSTSTRLSFVTTGWLLMYLAHRPEALRHYSHIVLDEIHERDLDMDLLCLLLKRSLEKNPNLRLVLMSATVDATQLEQRTLPGHPFVCGWQQLRPKDFAGDFVPYAFIQPNGSWCWSNAGFMASLKGQGLLVDTLMDPVLTSTMLAELKPATGVGGGQGSIGAVVFTHPDVDHILGNQAVPLDIPRLGDEKAQQDILAQAKSLTMMRLTIHLGHLLWQTLQLLGGPRMLPLLPSWAQPKALEVFRFAHYAFKLGGFNLDSIEGEKLPHFAQTLKTGDDIVVGSSLPVKFWQMGSIHSKSDSVLLLPESRVCYAGDLLFIGIAPVMWAGPAAAWVKALDDLLEATGEDWLFVPGHGPVTDAAGVRGVRSFFEYVHQAVSQTCADLPLAQQELDEECAWRVFEKMPKELTDNFHEPQRIVICALIERAAVRVGGPAKVDVKFKLKWISKMSEFELKRDYLVGTSPGRSELFLDYFQAPGVNIGRQPIVVGSRRFPTYPYYLDDLMNGALQGVAPRVRMDRFEKGGRVEVNPQLFETCVQVVEAVAKPGLCVLIFLPGLSEIEQLHEAFYSRKGRCPLDYHMLHSVVPHEQQKRALLPPPAGHCKVVLSTNIAESSITIPDVRYVLDFGIVRKMVFDEERAMQSLCNTWSSQATCRQRRGRCGRLQEGVIIYLFPRSHYERLQPYASPEVLGVPLESIYLKSRVLLHHLGPPEKLLGQLIDSPPQTRISAAAQNLRDLGALKGEKVASLGRIAVFMPTTIQLTKLVVLSWALGIPADGIVIAAALSTQDVFKMAAPANCRNLEDFPRHLAHNYITRARFDGGQFSEPIMYRNLYKEYLQVPKNQVRQYHQWLDDCCVSVSRMSQFAALVVELAAKLGQAVPSAKAHPALKTLSGLKRSQQLPYEEVERLFTQDDERLKFAIVGAFQPSFVQGEINTQNKNKGKINNCGFDPMRTCLLQQIKPAEMADVNNLWEFCCSLAPTNDVKLNDTGKVAFIECGDDSKVHVPPSDVVHQMPLVAQLLHQLMRQPCKFQVLTDQGIWHDANKIGSPNFLNGMKWHVNGMRTMGCPYWRSNMGFFG